MSGPDRLPSCRAKAVRQCAEDAGEFQEALGMRLDDLEHRVAESADPGLREMRTDVLDHTQLYRPLDPFGGARRHLTQVVGLELQAAVLTIVVPDPFRVEGFPWRDAGADPITVTRSCVPGTLTRSTQKPLSGRWKAIRSLAPERCSWAWAYMRIFLMRIETVFSVPFATLFAVESVVLPGLARLRSRRPRQHRAITRLGRRDRSRPSSRTPRPSGRSTDASARTGARIRHPAGPLAPGRCRPSPPAARRRRASA